MTSTSIDELERLKPELERLKPELERLKLQEKRKKLTEKSYLNSPSRQERVVQKISEVLESQGLKEGRMLEIGGRENPLGRFFPNFECMNMDLANTGENVVIGDITGCPEIESESFDVIISFDVFEHINRPWLAANEITRLLKPGGITFHSTLWSWRYHPCPIDYWRFSPDALEFLFNDLEPLLKEFDSVERRRNILGRGKYKVKADAIGGWRENWRVNFGGRKPSN
ncbi:class I SAM-dependent methyltransferase [Hirschia litorea]|uniref:Class I SAM-dependent methyltransferase n=1 Tax=Hirschia litorea TaxID=1199156 RepID=A0ABW2IPV3_9PROT